MRQVFKSLNSMKDIPSNWKLAAQKIGIVPRATNKLPMELKYCIS